MQVPLVMTIIGKDRTGLVESVARLIADHGGNWLESRMCRLGGEFAGILSASAPEDRVEALVNSLDDLKSEGLTVIIQRDDAMPSRDLTRSATLNLIGDDRPGIIYQIAAALAHQRINF